MLQKRTFRLIFKEGNIYFVAMGVLQIAKMGTKFILAGGCVYYSNEFGIWGNPKETEEGYARLKTVIRVSIMGLKRQDSTLGEMDILGLLGICIPDIHFQIF